MSAPKVLTQPGKASSWLATGYLASSLFACRSVAKASLLMRAAISEIENIVRACARGIPILDMKLLPRCGVKMKGEGDFDVDQSLFVNQAEPLMLNFLTVSSVEGQATAS